MNIFYWNLYRTHVIVMQPYRHQNYEEFKTSYIAIHHKEVV
jgi:hypothetical protein